MRESLTIPADGFEPFYSPFAESSVLIKADKNDPWVIYLEASNESPDTENDVILRKALEAETENFLSKGVISYDHLHKNLNDPKYIIGEPLDVKFNKSSTWVKAKLYKKVELAKSIKDMLESETTRLGSSVGGFIKRREGLTKSLSGITKVIWDEVAVTYKPVNRTTLGNVSLIPMGAFAKALAVGYGMNAANFTGGRALVGESKANLVDQMTNEFFKRVQMGQINTSEDVKDFLSYYGLERLYNKFAKLLVNKTKSK